MFAMFFVTLSAAASLSGASPYYGLFETKTVNVQSKNRVCRTASVTGA